MSDIKVTKCVICMIEKLRTKSCPNKSKWICSATLQLLCIFRYGVEYVRRWLEYIQLSSIGEDSPNLRSAETQFKNLLMQFAAVVVLCLSFFFTQFCQKCFFLSSSQSFGIACAKMIWNKTATTAATVTTIISFTESTSKRDLKLVQMSASDLLIVAWLLSYSSE